MRIFRFWAEYGTVLDVHGMPQAAKARGGSNISVEDALEDAKEKLNKAQRIINGEIGRDKNYETDIVEEIIETIDEHNIVTRNRYGALVLNSKNLLFIDIDQYRRTLFDRIFRSSIPTKQLMLQRIQTTMQKPRYATFGFRLYETAKGYRLLVTGVDFAPRSLESKMLMRAFEADMLYQWLCVEQNCYRARLTPKPYRIEQKAIRVSYLGRTHQQQQELDAWVHAYTNRSRAFSTCRLISSSAIAQTNRVIEYHDRVTGVYNNYRLA